MSDFGVLRSVSVFTLLVLVGCGSSTPNQNLPPNDMPDEAPVQQVQAHIVSTYCSSHLASTDGFGNSVYWERAVWSDGHETNSGTC